MKREDVSKIFENATEEQISKLLDINSEGKIVELGKWLKTKQNRRRL